MIGLTNPWVLLGIAIAMAGAFMGGVKVESDHRDAQLLVQEQAYHKTYVERATTLRRNADEVSAKLAKQTLIAKNDRQKFNSDLKEAKREGKLGRCDANPTDTGGSGLIWVNAGLWNRALAIGRGAGGDRGGADGAPAGAGAAAR